MKARIPLFTGFIFLISILFTHISFFTSLFVYDRSAILDGQWWRIMTGHLIHFGTSHMVYNLLILIIIGWVFAFWRIKYMISLYLALSCLVGLALIYFEPDVAVYGGLSGIVCGLIMYCCLQLLRKPSPWPLISFLTVGFLSAKILTEFISGISLLPYQEQEGFVLIPTSHLTGILTGTAFFIVIRQIAHQARPWFRNLSSAHLPRH